MNRPIAVILAGASIFFSAIVASAAGPKISQFSGNNKHNLSSRHPRTTGFKASTDDPRGSQICIFCHTPHNAIVSIPLWNRKDPTASFGHYSSATLVISHTPAAAYNEPTGSSRLCLSCHDGVTAGGIALGDVFRNHGSSPIPMAYGDKITGDALFTADKIKTGHHPVSFTYDANVLTAIEAAKGPGIYKFPPTLAQVKLDRQSRMQCTTCHNPHQNMSVDEGVEAYHPSPNQDRKIAPFWVYGGLAGDAVDDQRLVCESCHNFSTAPWTPVP